MEYHIDNTTLDVDKLIKDLEIDKKKDKVTTTVSRRNKKRRVKK